MADTKTLYSKMLRLVLPISFQQFMLALVGASDAIMLGKLNQNAMSAVSLASQVTFVFNLFMTAFVQVCLTILKNCGAVNQSSVISSMTVILNIVLNAIFIFGLWGFPAMGIRGAALAKQFCRKVTSVMFNELIWGCGSFCRSQKSGQNVSHMLLLYCGKVDKLYDHRRYFSSGRGFQIWVVL